MRIPRPSERHPRCVPRSPSVSGYQIHRLALFEWLMAQPPTFRLARPAGAVSKSSKAFQCRAFRRDVCDPEAYRRAPRARSRQIDPVRRHVPLCAGRGWTQNVAASATCPPLTSIHRSEIAFAKSSAAGTILHGPVATQKLWPRQPPARPVESVPRLASGSPLIPQASTPEAANAPADSALISAPATRNTRHGRRPPASAMQASP